MLGLKVMLGSHVQPTGRLIALLTPMGMGKQKLATQLLLLARRMVPVPFFTSVVTDASCTLRTWLTPSAGFESQYGQLSGINPNQVGKCWQIFRILCPQMRYLRQ